MVLVDSGNNGCFHIREGISNRHECGNRDTRISQNKKENAFAFSSQWCGAGSHPPSLRCGVRQARSAPLRYAVGQGTATQGFHKIKKGECKYILLSVVWGGIEPPTQGFSVLG